MDPLANITPVTSRSAAAQIADQLVLAIREERLRPSDPLPSERDLAQRFGVSRPTIREALTALELAGIVQSVKGSGTVVIGTSSYVAMWGVDILPTQLFEARLAIEPELARLAAGRRDPEDIACLRDVLRELEAELEATGACASDLELHRAVARAAHNPILERALEDALLALWRDFLRAGTLVPQTQIADLQQLVQLIDEGRADEAAELARRHLLFFRNEMMGQVAGRPAPRRPVERRVRTLVREGSGDV